MCDDYFTGFDACTYHMVTSHFRHPILPSVNEVYCHLCFASFSDENALWLHLYCHTNCNTSSGRPEFTGTGTDIQTVYSGTDNIGIDTEWLMISQNQQADLPPTQIFSFPEIHGTTLGSEFTSFNGNLLIQIESETENIWEQFSSNSIPNVQDFSQPLTTSSQQNKTPKGKINKCGHCPYASSRNDHLKSHLRTHTKEKAYKCKDCAFVTAYSGNLHAHTRAHKGEKPFKCDHCSYATAYRSRLKIHMRKHTGEKPYKCSECPYASATNSSLKTHMRVHTGEKPYKCVLRYLLEQ
ncbi:c2H2-type zinc-finger domain-containing protein [Ditylenchus destructor]|uniref:C2H2-type zinc-finger domain-containing protein n=1 Tax=Ditylenchus destructor TaxID=166010 RepID=A0AAD4MEV4_9BILA|nr:c2H2-type zinc-finger domain-containing protein [Ditylenchus destructor]